MYLKHEGILNDNLRETIDSVYTKWFVYFDSPFSSKKTYFTEYGEIPEGWHIENLGNYIESFSKTHPFDKEDLIFLNTSDILAGDVLSHEYMKISDMPGQAKKQIRIGDILFSEIRPANRRYALVTFPSDDYVVSTKLMVLRTKNSSLSNLRIYHYLTLDSTLEDLHREADGKSGTFPQITFDGNLRHRKFIVADEQTEGLFYNFLKQYYSYIFSIRQEIKSLEEMRAILLAKLSH